MNNFKKKLIDEVSKIEKALDIDTSLTCIIVGTEDDNMLLDVFNKLEGIEKLSSKTRDILENMYDRLDASCINDTYKNIISIKRESVNHQVGILLKTNSYSFKHILEDIEKLYKSEYVVLDQINESTEALNDVLK